MSLACSATELYILNWINSSICKQGSCRISLLRSRVHGGLATMIYIVPCQLGELHVLKTSSMQRQHPENFALRLRNRGNGCPPGQLYSVRTTPSPQCLNQHTAIYPLRHHHTKVRSVTPTARLPQCLNQQHMVVYSLRCQTKLRSVTASIVWRQRLNSQVPDDSTSIPSLPFPFRVVKAWNVDFPGVVDQSDLPPALFDVVRTCNAELRQHYKDRKDNANNTDDWFAKVRHVSFESAIDRYIRDSSTRWTSI